VAIFGLWLGLTLTMYAAWRLTTDALLRDNLWWQTYIFLRYRKVIPMLNQQQIDLLKTKVGVLTDAAVAANASATTAEASAAQSLTDKTQADNDAQAEVLALADFTQFVDAGCPLPTT